MINLGVILARACSKGLPGKAFRPLLGQPMIAYTFDHALESERITHVVLTTDCEPAEKLAGERGIEVIRRPPELATDTATVDDATRHAVETWEERHGARVDNIVMLYANIPARTPDIIDRCLDKLIETGCDSVRSVARIGKHHPDWLLRLDGDKLSQYRENSTYRRQDLEPLYYHNGAAIAFSRRSLFEALNTPDDKHAFFGKNRRAIEQNPHDAVDVDEPIDLLLAEAVLRAHWVKFKRSLRDQPPPA